MSKAVWMKYLPQNSLRWQHTKTEVRKSNRQWTFCSCLWCQLVIQTLNGKSRHLVFLPDHKCLFCVCSNLKAQQLIQINFVDQDKSSTQTGAVLLLGHGAALDSTPIALLSRGHVLPWKMLNCSLKLTEWKSPGTNYAVVKCIENLTLETDVGGLTSGHGAVVFFYDSSHGSEITWL